jgi:CubicO group peptidase (beta-lactamase class C family)
MREIAYLLIITFGFISCKAQNNTASLQQELDKIVGKYSTSQEFIGTVLIAHKGNVLLNKGYGFADRENKIQNSPKTNFFLASVSKLFTVACISDLKNKGLLDYNSPLSNFIPDYPNGKNITIEQLIKHESGIVDVVNERPYDFKKTFTSLPDLIDEFKYLPLNFTPGERYQYSTSGYILLAYIIEKVSGVSYSDYVQQNIFDKLNMTSSYSVMDTFPKNQAKGYDKAEGKFIPGEYFHPSQFVGAGNLSSTVDDLYKWYNGLYKTNTNSRDYQSTHHGRISGCTRTAFLFHEHADYVVIILSNYGDASVQEMGNELTDALWENSQSQNKLSAHDLTEFEGFYDYGDDGVLLVAERNGGLVAQLSGQPEFEIFPKSNTEFVWKAVDAGVKFVSEDDKEYAVHNQNGNSIKAPKIARANFNPSELKKIEGAYDYGDEGILTIQEREGVFWAKLSGQSEAEIYPLSEKEFFWMAVNARIKFETNTHGEIIKVVHYQNGLKTVAPKIE